MPWPRLPGSCLSMPRGTTMGPGWSPCECCPSTGWQRSGMLRRREETPPSVRTDQRNFPNGRWCLMPARCRLLSRGGGDGAALPGDLGGGQASGAASAHTRTPGPADAAVLSLCLHPVWVTGRCSPCSPTAPSTRPPPWRQLDAAARLAADRRRAHRDRHAARRPAGPGAAAYRGLPRPQARRASVTNVTRRIRVPPALPRRVT